MGDGRMLSVGWDGHKLPDAEDVTAANQVGLSNCAGSKKIRSLEPPHRASPRERAAKIFRSKYQKFVRNGSTELHRGSYMAVLQERDSVKRRMVMRAAQT